MRETSSSVKTDITARINVNWRNLTITAVLVAGEKPDALRVRSVYKGETNPTRPGTTGYRGTDKFGSIRMNAF